MLTNVLIAFAVVTASGLILAILLALASHFLFVKEDEKAQKIREVLPSINCGACGYAGCDDYAKAIAKGEKTNLCIPGGDSTSKQISEILGIEFVDVIEKASFVRCNGNLNDIEKPTVYDGIPTCKAASMIYGGPNACKYSCLGCGDCAAVCPVNAICVEDGIARVNREICIGCELCAKTCPKGIIEMSPETATVAVMCSSCDKGSVARKLCKNACIGCKKCENTCPHNAITVKNNLASIDYSKCTGCKKCVEVCPTKCIKIIG